MALWILPFLDEEKEEKEKKTEASQKTVKKVTAPTQYPSYSRPQSRFLFSLPEKAAVDLSNFLQRLDQITDRAVNSAAAAIDQATNRAATSAAASFDSALPMLEHVANSVFPGAPSGGGVDGVVGNVVAGVGSHAQDTERRGDLKRRQEEEELLLKILWKE